MAALAIGATTVILPSFDAREWLRLVATFGVTRTFMVPAHFIRLLEIPDDERAASRYVVVAAHRARRRTVPRAREAPHHRSAGPVRDRRAVRHERRRRHAYLHERMARPARECRVAVAGDRSPHSRRRGERAAGRRGRIDLRDAAGRGAASTTTRTTTRRRAPGTRMPSPSATSAISIPTGTSTSPTARPTW